MAELQFVSQWLVARRRYELQKRFEPQSGRLGIALVVLSVGTLAILLVLAVVWLIAYAQPRYPVPMDG